MNQNRYIIGIGAQKSGTSWLADYLSGHPEVLVPPFKELHFFDSIYQHELCGGLERKVLRAFVELAHKLKPADITKGTIRFRRFMNLAERARMCGDIDRYRAYFQHYVKDESVFCDITPEYALLTKEGFEAVKGLAPDVRLIFLMRNPIERFWSAVRMRAKVHPELDVLSEFDSLLTKPHFSLSTDYGKTLATVYEVFPKERVFVQFYEHLFNPDVIKQLCDFCDIQFIVPDTQKRVLEGISLPLTLERREQIYNRFSHVYEWANIEFGNNLPQSWQKDINQFQ